jgi:hypothetical protein
MLLPLPASPRGENIRVPMDAGARLLSTKMLLGIVSRPTFVPNIKGRTKNIRAPWTGATLDYLERTWSIVTFGSLTILCVGGIDSLYRC